MCCNLTFVIVDFITRVKRECYFFHNSAQIKTNDLFIFETKTKQKFSIVFKSPAFYLSLNKINPF